MFSRVRALFLYYCMQLELYKHKKIQTPLYGFTSFPQP
jgi:hypothetical protein